VSQLIYFFCMYFRQLRTHQAMGLVQNANEVNWRNFGRFRAFSCRLQTFYPRFGGRDMCLVLK